MPRARTSSKTPDDKPSQAEADAAALLSASLDKLATASGDEDADEDDDVEGAEPPAEAGSPAPKRGRPARNLTSAAAAAILRCHDDEVAAVAKSSEGPVATTTDGQRYLLTGAEPGDYVWLRVGPQAPQILKGN